MKISAAKITWLVLGLTLLFLAALSGCAPLTYHSFDSGYAGLERRLNRAKTNGAVMHMVVVHGIGNHAVGYSQALADGLARELRLEELHDDVTNGLHSALGVTNWLREYTLSNDSRVIRFHEVTWTPTTTNIKAAAFVKDATLDPHRVWLNRTLKDTLMDESLPDAVLYMNPSFRRYMQEPILETMARVATNAGPGDAIVLVAQSLGSKMTFDTALEYASDTNVVRFTEKMTDIIMLANQLPLLHLAMASNLEAPYSMSNFVVLSRTNSWKHFQKHGWDTNSEDYDLRIVAATDPNDLLSYPLRRRDVAPGQNGGTNDIKVTVGNIYSHNAWAIPFLFENPESAHDNYPENAWLLRMLAHGYGREYP